MQKLKSVRGCTMAGFENHRPKTQAGNSATTGVILPQSRKFHVLVNDPLFF